MSEATVGVILAGGQSSRMGGEDKRFSILGGQPLFNHVLQRTQKQVDIVAISANDKASRFSSYGLPLIEDVMGDQVGPLAGILSSLLWARANHPDCRTVATFPVDSPFYPEDLVSKLTLNLRSTRTDIAIARYKSQSSWLFGLWSVSLIGALQHYLIDRQERKVQVWVKNQRYCDISFDDYTDDPFFNINTPAELDIAIRRWHGITGGNEIPKIEGP